MSVEVMIDVEKSVAWHSTSAQDVLLRLESKADSGLADRDVAERREKFGRNELTPSKKI